MSKSSTYLFTAERQHLKDFPEIKDKTKNILPFHSHKQSRAWIKEILDYQVSL